MDNFLIGHFLTDILFDLLIFAASKYFQLWSVSVFYWFEKKYKVRMNDLFCKNWWYASALSFFCVIVGYFPVKLYLSSYCRDYILLGNFIVIVLSPFLVICTLNRKLYLFIKQNSSTAGKFFKIFIYTLIYIKLLLFIPSCKHKTKARSDDCCNTCCDSGGLHCL